MVDHVVRFMCLVYQYYACIVCVCVCVWLVCDAVCQMQL
jgi:hypothetical protein